MFTSYQMNATGLEKKAFKSLQSFVLELTSEVDLLFALSALGSIVSKIDTKTHHHTPDDHHLFHL